MTSAFAIFYKPEANHSFWSHRMGGDYTGVNTIRIMVENQGPVHPTHEAGLPLTIHIVFPISYRLWILTH